MERTSTTSQRWIFYSCLVLLLGLLLALSTSGLAVWNLTLLKVLQSHPTPLRDDFSILMAVIGAPFASLIFIGLLSLILLKRKRYKELALFLALFAAMTGFEYVSKMALYHPRPPDEYVRNIRPHGFFRHIPDISVPSDNSFPSGHCLRAVYLMGILGTLLRPRTSRAKAPLSFAIAIYCLAAGFTRVYLGAHWPGDVLGGFALGAMGWITYLRGRDFFEKRLPKRLPLP